MLISRDSLFSLSLILTCSLSLPLLAATKKETTPTFPIENELSLKDEFWQPNFDELLDSKLSKHYPRMNIQDSPDSYHIEAELPGVKKDEVEIKLKDDYLVISGEKKSTREELKKEYRRIERESGSFYRAISVPRNIDKDKITAELKDGILKVDMAKLKGMAPTSEKKILIK